MKVLQVVVGAAAARPCVQHLARRIAFATRVDLGEGAEKQPRAGEQGEEVSDVIGGNRINPALNVGEILLEQRHKIGIKALIEARIGSCLRPGALPLPLTYLFGEKAREVKMSSIPSHTWQLPGGICHADCQTCEAGTHCANALGGRLYFAAQHAPSSVLTMYIGTSFGWG